MPDAGFGGGGQSDLGPIRISSTFGGSRPAAVGFYAARGFFRGTRTFFWLSRNGMFAGTWLCARIPEDGTPTLFAKVRLWKSAAIPAHKSVG